MGLAAVGAGAALWLGGGSAIGAVLAGTATLATTLTAVATVGAVIGAVGAITHDKTLSTIGMVAGAIGGIGALAANAGLLGASATTESLFGANASAVDGDLAMAGETSRAITGTGADFLPNVTDPNVLGSGSTIDALGNENIFQAMGGDVASSLDPASGGLINGAIPKSVSLVGDNVSDWNNSLVGGTGGGVIPSGQADAAKAGDGDMAMGGTTVQPTSLPGAATSPEDIARLVKIPGSKMTGADGVSYVSDGMKWTKDAGFLGGLMSSPMAQYGMIQAGGALIGGMFDPLKPAQVGALDAQSAANRAAANLTTQQVNNMKGQLPVATRSQPVSAAGVTGAPAGLINNRPPMGAAA